MVDSIAWKDCCQLFERIGAIRLRIEEEIKLSVTALLEDTKGREQMAELESVIEFAKGERKKDPEESYYYNLISQDIMDKEAKLVRYREEYESAMNITEATALYKSRVIGFLEFLDAMQGRYHTATFQEKRNALDVLGIRVKLVALRAEEKRRGKIPTLENLQSRMVITYAPLFTGVNASGEGRPQNQ
jgi:hypothetical protein